MKNFKIVILVVIAVVISMMTIGCAGSGGSGHGVFGLGSRDYVGELKPHLDSVNESSLAELTMIREIYRQPTVNLSQMSSGEKGKAVYKTIDSFLPLPGKVVPNVSYGALDQALIKKFGGAISVQDKASAMMALRAAAASENIAGMRVEQMRLNLIINLYRDWLAQDARVRIQSMRVNAQTERQALRTLQSRNDRTIKALDRASGNQLKSDRAEIRSRDSFLKLLFKSIRIEQ